MTTSLRVLKRTGQNISDLVIILIRVEKDGHCSGLNIKAFQISGLDRRVFISVTEFPGNERAIFLRLKNCVPTSKKALIRYSRIRLKHCLSLNRLSLSLCSLVVASGMGDFV